MTQGQLTQAIAQKLKRKLEENQDRYSGIEVFHDHGNSTDPNVCEPTAYMGRRYGADATLSSIDIVLVKDKKVILAVEVEESMVRPKVVLGDVFAVVLADRIRILDRSYPVDNALLVIALTASTRGKRVEKYARLERHLGKYIDALQRTNPSTGIKKVRIVTAEPNDLVRRIERLIRLEVGK